MTRNEQQAFDPALYDADFFIWTQRQAAALRAMPRDASIDIEHVAEEIEDLGKRDLNEVTSLLVLVLQHVIKLQVDPASRDAAHWYQEASNSQASARRAFSPGMRRLIDLDEAWTDAWRGMRRLLDDIGTDENPSGKPCPFTLDELLAKVFDIDAAVADIWAANDMRKGGASHDPQ